MNTQDKYGGQYIATRSFNDHEVVAFGTNPEKVVDKAKRICDSPIVVFVPPKGAICIY